MACLRFLDGVNLRVLSGCFQAAGESICRALPDRFGAVLMEDFVGGEDGEGLGDGLGDEEAVEWVSVVVRE